MGPSRAHEPSCSNVGVPEPHGILWWPMGDFVTEDEDPNHPGHALPWHRYTTQLNSKVGMKLIPDPPLCIYCAEGCKWKATEGVAQMTEEQKQEINRLRAEVELFAKVD